MYRELKAKKREQEAARKRKSLETADAPQRPPTAPSDTLPAPALSKRHKANPSDPSDRSAEATTAVVSKSRRSLSKGLDGAHAAAQAAAIDVTEEGTVKDSRPTVISILSSPEPPSVPAAAPVAAGAVSRSRSPPTVIPSSVGSVASSTGSAEGRRRSQREKPMTAEEKAEKEEAEQLKKVLEESLQAQKEAQTAGMEVDGAKTASETAVPQSGVQTATPPPLEKVTAEPPTASVAPPTAPEEGSGEVKKGGRQRVQRLDGERKESEEAKEGGSRPSPAEPSAQQPPLEAAAEPKAVQSTPASKPRTRTTPAQLHPTPQSSAKVDKPAAKVDAEELKTDVRPSQAKPRSTPTSARQSKVVADAMEVDDDEVKEVTQSQPQNRAGKGKRAGVVQGGEVKAVKGGERKKGGEAVVQVEGEEEEAEELSQPQSGKKATAKPQGGEGSATKRKRLRRANGDVV